jgi:hypothetical protein
LNFVSCKAPKEIVFKGFCFSLEAISDQTIRLAMVKSWIDFVNFCPIVTRILPVRIFVPISGLDELPG